MQGPVVPSKNKSPKNKCSQEAYSPRRNHAFHQNKARAQSSDKKMQPRTISTELKSGAAINSNRQNEYLKGSKNVLQSKIQKQNQGVKCNREVKAKRTEQQHFQGPQRSLIHSLTIHMQVFYQLEDLTLLVDIN